MTTIGKAPCGCGTPFLGSLRILTVASYAAALAFGCAVLRHKLDAPCVILPLHAGCHEMLDKCYFLRCGACATSVAFLLNALAMAGQRRQFNFAEFNPVGTMVALLDSSSPKQKRQWSLGKADLFELGPALLGCLCLAVAATVTGTATLSCHLRFFATRVGVIAYGFHMGFSTLLRFPAATMAWAAGSGIGLVSMILKAVLSIAYCVGIAIVIADSFRADRTLDSDETDTMEWTIGLSALLFNVSYYLDFDQEKTFGDVWPRLAARSGACKCTECDEAAPAVEGRSICSPCDVPVAAAKGQYDYVYVAPHADDVAFSCSALIKRQRMEGKRVLVVTVFTARQDRKQADGPQPSENVYAKLETRLEEDIECMQQMDVDWKHANFSELVFRHGVSKERPCLPMHLGKAFCSSWCCSFTSNQQLIVALACYLQSLVASSQCIEVFGPAGIGQHPDHLLVHRACRQLRDFVRVSFYHDFPYCSYQLCNAYRHWDLRHLHLRSVNLRVDTETVCVRKAAIDTYSSQMLPVFGSRQNAQDAVDAHPHEGILAECCSKGAQRYGAEEETKQLTCSKRSIMAVGLDFCSGMLVAMLACEVGRPAITSAFAVATLSLTRVVLVALAAAELRWICILSVIFVAIAFTQAVASPAFDDGASDDLTTTACCLCGLYVLQVVACVYEASISAKACTVCTKPNPSQKLRVLVITDYMPPQVHGIALHMANMVNTLRGHGHYIEVFSPSGTEGTPFYLWWFTNPWNEENRIALFPSCLLVKELLFGHWDVVHVSQPCFMSWYVLILAWFGGQAIYQTIHIKEKLAAAYMSGPLLWVVQLAGVLTTTLPSWLLATMEGWLTDNHYLEHGLAHCTAAERCAIAPSSVDGNLFKVLPTDQRLELRREVRSELGINEDCIVWTVVGRVAPEKRIHEAIDALALYRRKYPHQDVCLIVCGDGPSRQALEQKATQENLPVIFLGMVQPARISQVYQAADVGISCCDVETFGLAILEALACGLPHVLPHCEIFDELHGEALAPWMYTKDDIEGITEACRLAAGGREELAAAKARNAFNARIFWSWDEAAGEQEKQYVRCKRLRCEGKRQRKEIMQHLVVGLSIWWLCVQASHSVMPLLAKHSVAVSAGARLALSRAI